ncbi:MAG: glycosyltransferase family 4 protein [Cyanobacteriota bacterium]
MSNFKDVLMVSKPVAPPWQDSNKNLTKNIISFVNNVRFHILTPKGYQFNKDNVVSEDIYQSTGDYAPAIQQNLQALFYLITVNKEIDLFHFFFTPNPKTSLVLKHLTKFKNRPCIQTITSTPKIYKDLKNLFFADKIVTLSDFNKKNLEDKGLNNIVRIYPGINLQELDNYDTNDSTFKEENNLQNNILILFAGDYEFSGANKTILESIPPIVSKYPQARFIFACRNKTEKAINIESELHQYAIDLGIEKYVMFIGTATDMLKVIRSIDICLFPVKSLYAKMDIPLVLLECMAYSKPLIITDMKPLNEIMIGDIGFKVPVNNKDELIKSTLDLLNSEDLRIIKGNNARKTVENHFNMEKLAVEYEKLYQEILNE